MKVHPLAQRRDALTLLEVLAALAVLLFSVVGLGTLMTISGDRATEIRHQSWALQRCQTKMAEVIVGAVPLESKTDMPFDEDPDWLWSVDVQDSGITGLMNVTVRVARQRADRSRMETSLTQMVLDPALRGGSAPPATADPASSSTPSRGSSGTQPAGDTGGR
jgi:hypothetical protein